MSHGFFPSLFHLPVFRAEVAVKSRCASLPYVPYMEAGMTLWIPRIPNLAPWTVNVFPEFTFMHNPMNVRASILRILVFWIAVSNADVHRSADQPPHRYFDSALKRANEIRILVPVITLFAAIYHFHDFNPLLDVMSSLYSFLRIPEPGSDDSISTMTDAASNRTDLIGSGSVDGNNNTAPSASSALFILFIVFQLIGLVGSILILFTACISKLVRKRHWSWYVIMFYMTLELEYCLLTGQTPGSLLAGAPIDWRPEYPLCLTQAALIYTVPTLTACSSLALVIQVLVSVRALAAIHINPTAITSNDGGNTSLHRLWTFLLLSIPYLSGAGMFAMSLVIGLRDRATVRREPGGFYCNMENPIPGKLSAAIVAVIMLICVSLGITICVILRKNWNAVRSDVQVPLATVTRVLCFSTFSVVATVLGLLFFVTPRSSHGFGLEITLSLLPVAAVVTFGSQKDLVRSWKAGFQAFFHSCLVDPRWRMSNTTDSKINRDSGDDPDSDVAVDRNAATRAISHIAAKTA
ncbi:uncharacterized protein C8R40DRAFT_1065401 [Lentinula edodes]|uniref:uncharacterized protein n=1 Tax=Lentinula edodes TaxID=5353 RepID=UPI001E8D39CE|nr:uncharacterized protein C8R40DRAFT_1065401 [Lentinula edodes]KAH7880327.1 hypothetical protein C8R40DRAFT_1065401 [Lentinula edodes]